MTDLNEEKSDKISLQRQRSPGYPQIGLARSIELTRKVYEGAHTGEIDNTTLIGLLGYSSVSGQGLSVASAIKKFGLIEGRGEKLKVSPLALKILEPMSDEEKLSAINEAGLKPELYSEILNKFGGKVPNDDVMRSFLIRQYQFAPTGADNFVKAFRETIECMSTQNLAKEEQKAEPIKIDVKEVANITETSNLGGSGQAAGLPAGERLTFRLSSTAKVHVIFEGEITAAAIEKLIKFLDLSKDGYEG